MYVTYEEYRTEVCGTLTPEVFTRLAYRAQKAIDAATFGRVAAENPVRESVRQLMFELVMVYASADNGKGGALSSVSNDGVSESYTRLTQTEMQQRENELILMYLSGETAAEGTPLLYRGCD